MKNYFKFFKDLPEKSTVVIVDQDFKPVNSG